MVHQPIVQRQPEPQAAPVAQEPSYQQPAQAVMQQPAPQPVQQPLFQQPQAAAEPMAPRQDFQPSAPQAQPNYAAAAAQQARPIYQAAQPRPPMHGAAAQQRPEQPSYQARSAAPQYQEEPRQQRSSGFNGFNIFGRPKPAAREEQWEERAEPSAKSITQTQPLFGDEFDDEIEIPTFLRKQAN